MILMIEAEPRRAPASRKLLVMACALAVGFLIGIIAFVLFGGDASLEHSGAGAVAPAPRNPD